MSTNGQPGPWDRPDDEPGRVIKGPWRTAPKPPQPPRFSIKPRRGRREPIINNWPMLVGIGLLIFVAPPVARWIAQLIGQMLTR
ncbi:MAG: hypothetical protein ACYDD1_06245 [Caulobacteraceae bacterium]